MDIEKIKNNYLLSIGCSIKNEYIFIKDLNDIFNTTGLSKELIINNKKIQLNYKLLNNKKLFDLFNFSTFNILNYISNIINLASKQGINKNEILGICSKSIVAETNYFSEYIKYLPNKLPINEDILELMISLINNSISTLNNNFDKLLQRYNANIQEININAANEVSKLNQQTLAEVSNASKLNYGNEYYYDYITHGYIQQGSSMSTITETQLKGYLQANTMTAEFNKANSLEKENAQIIDEINNIVTSTIAEFNKKLKEIIVIKLPDLFEDIEDTSDNLEICPYNAINWLNNINNFSVEEYSEIKEVLDYYSIDLSTLLEEILSDKIYKYYINNDYKTDYNEGYLKLYLYLTNQDKFTSFEILSNKIYNHFNNLIDEYEENFNLNFDSVLNHINNCIYLFDNKKSKLINNIDNIKTNIKVETKIIKHNNFIKKIFSFISIIIDIVILIIIYLNSFSFQDFIVDSLIYAIPLFILVHIVIKKIKKLFTKKIPNE